MELIIKPTGKCNFSCKFCSAQKNTSLYHFSTMTDQLKELLRKINPQTIIFTGGDPLLCSPDFYEEVLAFGEWNISFTTNLKDYILNPGKWRKLFRNPRVSVGTSFQYGDGRKWDNSTVYDENMFKKAFYKFKDDIGYALGFISVIGKDNEKYAFKHIDLAQELNTKCKLNPLLPLGKSEEFYPMYKIVELWLQIYESGKSQWLDQNMSLFKGGCGLNIRRICTTTIRAAQFLNDGTLQLSTCEDDLMKDPPILLNDLEVPTFPIKEAIRQEDQICSDCVFCELFNFCNGCHQQRKLNKLVPEHCREMKKKIERIKAAKWRLQ